MAAEPKATQKYRKVTCPTCGTAVEWRPENSFKPFCCERCRLIDLGEWAMERYRLPTAEQDRFDDLDGTGKA
jgi:endogenous inhibitor of DNA gyrase (YacG/DUF329 family)